MITAEQYNKLREKEILDLTNKYKSSDNEVSVVKGIPISLYLNLTFLFITFM